MMLINGSLWSHVEMVVTITKYKKFILIMNSIERRGLMCRALSAVSMSSKIFLVHILLIETVIIPHKLE